MANRYEKTLSVTYYQGNANQNNNEALAYTCQNSKVTRSKYWQGCGEKGTVMHCWQKCKSVQPIHKTVWRLLKKLKIEILHDLVIPLQGIYQPPKTKPVIQKDICTHRFIIALSTVEVRYEATHGWMKMWYDTYNGILFSHNNE